MHRRGFLAAAGAAASAFTIVPGRALGYGGGVAANSRINVAFIGVGSQGLRVMFELPGPARRPGRGRRRPGPLGGQLSSVEQGTSSATTSASSSASTRAGSGSARTPRCSR